MEGDSARGIITSDRFDMINEFFNVYPVGRRTMVRNTIYSIDQFYSLHSQTKKLFYVVLVVFDKNITQKNSVALRGDSDEDNFWKNYGNFFPIYICGDLRHLR